MKKTVIAVVLLVLAVCLSACTVKMAVETPEKNGEENAAQETEKAAETPKVETAEAPATEEPEPTPSPTATPAKRKTVNVALEKPVTADYSEKGYWEDPAAIVDGDPYSRWSGFDTQRPKWQIDLHHEITIDLQGRYELSDFTAIWETLTGYYTIQVTENGTDWTDVYTSFDTYLTASPVEDEDFFPKDVFATMVRIVVDFPADESFEGYPYCSLYEFEIYAYVD